MDDAPVSMVPLDEVRGHLADLEPPADGVPREPVMFVDLSTPTAGAAAVEAAIRSAEIVAVGVVRSAVSPELYGILDALTFSLTPERTSDRTCVTVTDVAPAARRFRESVTASPKAALAMRRLVEVTDRLPVRQGLAVESAVYSMLLAGGEFAEWRAAHERRDVPVPDSDAVSLERVGDELRIRLDMPQRRNAYSRHVRDGLVDALDLALTDDTIERVVLTGAGPAFCSGGDLDEFGGSADVSAAHLVRLQRNAASRVHALEERMEVRLHGACIGAGIEIPSFAARVLAREDTVIALPELAMGLVPGAGGTVGITRRIGRWRCAWLHLAGERIGVDVALDWGLVDERG